MAEVFLLKVNKGGRGVENIGQIIKTKQPDTYRKLNKNRKRRRGKKKEHLSFDDFDRMMRGNIGIDESRCRGR